MPTVALAPCPKLQFFDSNGDPASGYKVFSYVTGTSTKKATYTDATGNSANTNPIVLDSRGECSAWLLTDANYKFRLCIPGASDPPSSSVWDVDNFGFASPTFQTATVTGNLTVGGVATFSGGVNIGQMLCLPLSGETETIAAGTSKFTHRMPRACTVLNVYSSLGTASSSDLVTVDINDDTVSILGVNKLSIDSGEKTSATAATPTTIANASIAADSEITFDIDAAGTGAKGLKVYLEVTWA